MTDVDVFLEHHGIKGMRWGVRNATASGDHAPGVSKKISRDAKKDAQEFARAKAFYGQGAGTRRKLIKQSVEAKSKRIPGYKQAFDHHLTDQDMSKHVSKAISERKRTDRIDVNKKRFGAVARRLTGEPGTQAAIVAAVIGGVAFFRSNRGKAIMNQNVNRIKTFSSTVAEKFIRSRNAKNISKFL